MTDVFCEKGHERLDRRKAWCLVLAGAAAALLLAVVLAGWPGLVATGLGATATGGIPDSGAQRDAMIRSLDTLNQKLEQTNQKLDKIFTLMESGKLKVVMGDADKK